MTPHVPIDACRIDGHRFQHVRNLSGSESAPLPQVSLWRCVHCGAETREAGWQGEQTQVGREL